MTWAAAAVNYDLLALRIGGCWRNCAAEKCQIISQKLTIVPTL